MKNPVRLWLGRMGFTNSTTPVVTFARKRISARAESEKESENTAPSGKVPQQRDFLSRFLEAHQKDPVFISNERVLALTVANMFAGSDTTAISLRSIFYNLLRNPSDMKKLLDELQRGHETGELTGENGLVRWNEVYELPFLSAVIKEALRCHPAAGLLLERVVPPQGLELCGERLPGGTIVGCNAWVIHQDAKIFGADADRFRPDRWIEASPEHKRVMENSLFSFGAGARTCIGKNISYLEMYKLVPAILQRFEVSCKSVSQSENEKTNL
jgi:cytochrome P450